MEAWAIVDKETGVIVKGPIDVAEDALCVYEKRKQAREEHIKGVEKVRKVEITIIEEEN